MPDVNEIENARVQALLDLHTAVARTALVAFRNPSKEYAEMLRAYADILRASSVAGTGPDVVIKLPDYREVEFE